jgi:hypothetical protein
LENLAFREEISSDAVVLHDFALLLAIPLRDGCDFLDVKVGGFQPPYLTTPKLNKMR